ncbi:MAG: hypothetical protein ACKOTH_05070 [Solirubrobacterales bacterium]
MATPAQNGIVAFTGVYDADGTLAGELSYWVGAHVTGSRQCAICEITHGRFTEKARWRELAAGLPVPFEAVHLDERPAAAWRLSWAPASSRRWAATRTGWPRRCAHWPDCVSRSQLYAVWGVEES